MSNPTLMDELRTWWLSLPAEYLFLLALPFVVGIAGLLRLPKGDDRRSRRPDDGHA